MKRWIWAVLIFLVAGVVGGYSVAHYHEEELQYSRNVVNGQTAIEQANYAAAENYFSRALTKKKDDQTATALLRQTKKFVRAESEFKSHEFTSARIDYRSAKQYQQGSKTLKDRADTRITLIDKIKKNVKKFNKELKQAKSMNAAWNFYGSNAIIDGLLSSKEFKKNYYSTLYDQVIILQRFNNAGIVADQSAFSDDTTPDNDEENTPSGPNRSGITPQYRGPGPAETSSSSKKKDDAASSSKKDATSSSKKKDDSSKSSSKQESSAKDDASKNSSSAK